MATFTMELREAMKQTDDIGLNHYPIFDESYRIPLNKKITDHFLMREIGTETIELFRLYMSRKMNEIMPFYNQMYQSQKLVIDPLNTINIKQISDTSTHNETETANTVTQTSNTANTGTATTDSVNDAKSRVVGSNTPQNMLSDFGDYADGATDSISKTTGEGTSEEESTSDTTSNGDVMGTDSSDGSTNTTNSTSGYSGNQSEMLQLFRSTFMNIDLDIINRLDSEHLFMELWSSGDSTFDTETRYYGNAYTNYGIYPRF